MTRAMAAADAGPPSWPGEARPFDEHLLNALSILYPESHRLLTDAVVDLARRESLCANAELLQLLRDLGIHHRERAGHHAQLAQAGLPIERLGRTLGTVRGLVRRRLSLRNRIAAAAAFEDIKTALTDALTQPPARLLPSDEPSAILWKRLALWEAHRSPTSAFEQTELDPMAAGVVKRCVVLLCTTPVVLGLAFRLHLSLLSSGGHRSDLRAWSAFVRAIWADRIPARFVRSWSTCLLSLRFARARASRANG